MPQGTRRQAVRRQFDSLSSRLLQGTILDFRLRLLLLFALTLPFILLGGLVHSIASGRTWTTSAYLVYGLLFRVPALGAVRLDEPPASAAVLNAVFLFGVFGFAILIGLIGEEVKGTVKALRAVGAPLDLYGHIVLLNFTADPTAVALLRQVAEDLVRPGSPLYGRPIAILAARPPPPAVAAVAVRGDGRGELEPEGAMRRVVADALQGRGPCEWHLRAGSSCRTDDLARVCVATAAYVVLLADPRVATTQQAAAAGAASSLQAQALMCLTLAMAPVSPPPTCRKTGSRGVAGAAAGRPAAWGRSRGAQPTIVVQSPADAPHPLPLPGVAGGVGPISTFRSIAAAESLKALVVEVRDRGILDRLVAQTVLQPGVATVLARLFGSNSDEGTGFVWVEWTGPPAPATDPVTANGLNAAGMVYDSSGGASAGGAGRQPEAPSVGLRRRRATVALPRTLSYSSAAPVLSAVAAAASTAGGSGGGVKVDGIDGWRSAELTAKTPTSAGPSAARDSTPTHRTQLSRGSTGTATGGGRFTGRSAASHIPSAEPQPRATAVQTVSRGAAGCSVAVMEPFAVSLSAAAALAAATAAAPRARPPPLLCGSSSTAYGEVRALLESAAAATTTGGWERAGGSGRWGRPASPARTTSASKLDRDRTATGAVVVGYLSSATGTLRLNPRDGSPVYPGDQLVLLVSKHPQQGKETAVRRRNGWFGWGRSSHGDVSDGFEGAAAATACRDGVPSPGGRTHGAVMATGKVAACGGEAGKDKWDGPASVALMRRSEGATGGGGCGGGAGGVLGGLGGSGPAELAGDLGCRGGAGGGGGAGGLERVVEGATATSTLQGWHSMPMDTVPNDPPLGGMDAAAVAAARGTASAACSDAGDGAAEEATATRLPVGNGRIPEGPAAETSATAAATAVDVGGAAGAADTASDGPNSDQATKMPVNGTDGSATGCAANGVRGSGRGNPGCTPPRPPPAPPAHIIVISRTEVAVREVVAGLQEFAPAGSTISLITHEAASGGGLAAAAAAAAPPPPPVVVPPPGAPVADTPTAHAGSGNGAPRPFAASAAASVTPPPPSTAVLPCLSATWPAGEDDLVLAGLSSANAVLICRDSGLLPQEADATAMAVVLQLYHTLTDPTRSPLRRRCPPPAAVSAGGAAVPPSPVLTSHLQQAPPELTRLNPSLPPQPEATSQHTPWDAPPAAPSSATSAAAVAAAALPSLASKTSAGLTVATAANGGLAGLNHGSQSAPQSFITEARTAPLHVVVCLYGTRARDTLRSFLASLTAPPPFTLEALVPEEYRALLLAGVVRQPQSHAILTELLSDRLGSPEVYLVPPGRLLPLAVQAAPSVPNGPGAPPSQGVHTAAVDTSQTPVPEKLGLQSTATGTMVESTVPTRGPTGPSGPGMAGWRFRDVAMAVRAWGCTAIGVLRDGDGSGGDVARPGGLQLAPPPDVPLGLAPGDRLVVLAADPV